MDKFFMGIDPGLKGSISIIDQDRNIVEIHDMPTIKVNGKNHLDFTGIKNIIKKYQGKAFCYIEHAQSMPGNMAQAMFNYGTGFGALLQCLVDFEISHQKIRPNIWKKEFTLNDDKGLSIKTAKELFMGSEKYIYNKGHDGRAEALLLAEFSRRKAG